MSLKDMKYAQRGEFWVILDLQGTPFWSMVFPTKKQAAMAYWLWEYCK